MSSQKTPDPDRDIRRFFPSGAVIFQEEDSGGCAYVIERGAVEISTLRGGERLVLARRGAGEIFGEMAIVDDKPRSATVMAVEDCELLILSRDQLQNRLAELDPVLRMVLTVILDRFRDTLSGDRRGATKPEPCATTADTAGRIALHRAAIGRIELEQSLRLALERHELTLHYQPIVRAGGRIAGFEALARWNHPTRGLLAPGCFIEAAEDSGLIAALSRWVLSEACGAIRRFQDSGCAGEDFFVSVNVTAREICDPDFLDCVQETLAAEGVDPGALMLEITESMLMADPNLAVEMLGRFARAGVSISIDDFGSGYSSFGYLVRYPVRVLKLDRSFVIGLEEPRNAEVVKAMIGLGHGLGLKVVAEGVETERHAGMLEALNCDCMQGYLFSRPVPFADALTLSRRDMRRDLASSDLPAVEPA